MNSSEDNSLTFDVIQSGPTRTTSTLTPTTLRNIEQSFLELEDTPGQQIAHQDQAGFVPPCIPFQPPPTTTQQAQQQQQQQQPQLPQPHTFAMMNVTTNNNSSHSMDDDEDDSRAAAGLDEDSMGSESMSNASWPSEKTTTSTPPPGQNKSTKTPARRGGRRPNKPSNLSPEEEEKRSLRRERNKLAAARCRKRRVDHTNELTGEVEGLEKKRQSLQNDIKQLQIKKEELEFLLEAHRDHCRLWGRSSSPPDIKPQLQQQLLAFTEKIKTEPLDFDAPTPPTVNTDSSSADNVLLLNNPLMSSASKGTPTPTSSVPLGLMGRPSRPSSLAVPFTLTPSQALAGARSGDFGGIPISTPSTGMFNFDSLMDGGTGLTPVSGPLVPTSTGLLGGQAQRNPLELVTPTSEREPSKLVSL